jgi:tetratricopeptide (TPR) repeat protein
MAEPSLWDRMTARLFPTAQEQQGRLAERIAALDRALMRDPGSAASYVNRGEAYLEAGDPVAAVKDFRQALALAEAQFKTETWGVVAQAVRDRALRGLQQAEHRGH